MEQSKLKDKTQVDLNSSMNEEINQLMQVLDGEQINDDEPKESDSFFVLLNIRHDDPTMYITRKEIIDSIKPGDSAIHLIGVVTNVSDVKEVNAGDRVIKVLNFDMEFKDNIKLPISIWEEEIPRLKAFIRLNSILHLDSPFARPQDASSFTNGRDYSLTCRSNTVINTLGEVEVKEDSKNKDPLLSFTKIDDAVNDERSYHQLISLTCYIKTDFRKDTANLSRKKGIITDTIKKMNVHLLNSNNEKNWEVGEPVLITGKIVEEKKIIILQVESSDDIKKISGDKLAETVLEKIFLTPKRKSLSFDSDIPSDKKLKL